MRLLSAYDDLMERTINGLSGALGKVRFLGMIRSSSGVYEHWGLERTYGRESAQCAMKKAHAEVLLAELSTPLADLWRELESEAENEAVRPVEYARSLMDIVANVPELSGGSEKHHRYVIKSLLLLAQTRGSASRQVA
jgi:hypothetical protein